MRRTSQFTKKTRSGKILTVAREHYLRDDLYCGSAACKACPMRDEERKLEPALASAAKQQPSPSERRQYFVLDTNVLLHQMDLLEACAAHPERGLLSNLILLQTVLDEVRGNSVKLYNRVRAFQAAHPHAVVFCNEHHRATYVERVQGESPNDRNDRAIRVASAWLAAHLPSIRITLLTNDKDNRAKASVGVDKVDNMNVPEFVAQHGQAYPDLVELMARMASFEKEREKGAWTYPDHLSPADLAAGLASGKLKKGTYKVNRDYFSESTVASRDFEQPIFVPDLLHANRAIDGDIVVVEVLPRSQWKAPSKRLAPSMEEESLLNTTGAEHGTGADVEGLASDVLVSGARPTGRVVGIHKRNWRPYCGSLEVSTKKKGSLLFLSVNKRIPRIRISTAQAEALMDKRILVQIDSWPADSKYPLGHYTKTLGDIGDKDTETQVLLIEHDIPTAAWSQAVLACLPKDEFNINPKDCIGRSDFRNIQIFSIDPPGCTDIDDALHCRPLPNGNTEYGVHIADTSFYVRPDTALDAEAANRGTSVYLVDKRIDMIPSQLSTNLCSLRANIDRLTFSVLWEVTPQGDIVDTTFHKAVIRSAAAMTYQQAQERMDSEDTDSITVACKGLRTFARQLKKKRFDAGALMLASSEVKFVIDRETNQPTDVSMYQMREANSVVEEFMLLANVSVGKRIVECYPTFALLRRHPVPAPEMFDPLIRAAAAAGFTIRVDSSKALADSLDLAVVPDFPFFNKLLRMLATRCMTQALYFSSGDLSPKEYFHYGLAMPIYTHFTSPIRRYADIVVHRLLSASLGLEPLPPAVQDRTRVHDMAEVINHRHRMAQLVSRASGELFTLLYFQNRDVQEDAMVVAVKSNGIRVMVPRYGIEAGITLWTEPAFDEEQKGAVAEATSSRAKNPWQLDESGMALRGPGGVVYKIFEQLRVRIYVQEAKSRRKWLQIELVDKEALTSSKPTALLEKHMQQGKPADSKAATAAAPAGGKGKKRDAAQVAADADDEEAAKPAAAKPSKAAAAAAPASAKKGDAAPTKKRQKL